MSILGLRSNRGGAGAEPRSGTEHPARYGTPLPGGRVECGVCPCRCRLKEGQRGACFVRANRGGHLVLSTYGRSSGFCIDPIEKKPLNHFLPGTPVLSFGTAGCNLACRFCQNWDISKSRELDTLMDDASPERIAEAAVRLGCRSVAFTYNDPVIFLEYAVDIAEACRARDIRTVAVTAGYILDEPRREFFGAMDAANVDLKGFTERFYNEICGAELAPVLETLVYLKTQTQVWFELTTLLIPGENDGSEEIDAMTRWVVDSLGPDVPMHFTAFHPDFQMQAHPPTPPETLQRARQIALHNGVRFPYTGNVHDEEGGSTFCPHCGEKVIGRDWFHLTLWRLNPHGNCLACGSHIPGLFDPKPGSWGPKRQPVRLSLA